MAISNWDDFIFSGDVVDRIEELEQDTDRDEDDNVELANLRQLQKDTEIYSEDWKYGVDLIRETAFNGSFAREYFEDCREEGAELDVWPYSHIDWESAADSLRTDYTSIEFDGVTYYVR